MSKVKTYIIMGVSGSGKSLVGRMLAEAADADFEDGDDFHPPANKAKMSAKIPLTDEDRWPWLESIRRRIEEKRDAGRSFVVACSALKRIYRSMLRKDDSREELEFVYLKGSRELIGGRIGPRQGHFFPSAMLDSQFATLEEPAEDEAVIVNVDQTPEEIVADILRQVPQAG